MIATEAQPLTGMIGVVHRAGRSWHVLVADLAGSLPRVVASESFPADRPDRVETLFEQAKVGHVIQIVPASSSVARTCRLPDSDEETLASALRLQAETWFLAGAADHRTAGAVLESAEGEPNRTGLVVSWPESANVTPAPVTAKTSWIPEPAALAALLGGERPAEPLVALDRHDGSLTIALCDTGGAGIRSTHDDFGDADWSEVLGGIVVETAMSAEHSPAFSRRLADDVVAAIGDLDRDESACELPGAIRRHARSRLENTGDEAWWRTYGVAAGAVLAACGPFAATATLQQDAADDSPAIFERLAHAISQPRTATTVAVACLVFLALLPLAVSGIRLSVLQSRYGDLDAVQTQVQAAQDRLDMYEALDGSAWPMTRLLAEIASNTPDGINITSLLVSLDQGGFTARGEALGRDGDEATERVALMQELLADAGISSIAPDWGDPNNFGAYEFTLSGTITNPYQRRELPIDRDYGLWSMWERQNGLSARGGDDDEEAVWDVEQVLAAGDSDDVTDPMGPSTVSRPGTRSPGSSSSRPSSSDSGRSTGGDAPAVAIPTSESTNRSDRRRDRGETIGSRGEALDGDSGEARTGDAAGGGDIPEPLSEEQIKAMDLPTTQAYLSRLADARKRVRGVEGMEEVDARLKDEWRMLVARSLELNQREDGGS